MLALRSQSFIDPRGCRGDRRHLFFIAILPNVLPVILVAFSFAIPSAIFTEAFLCLVDGRFASAPPGGHVHDGIKTLLSNPRQLLLPAMMISIAVLAFNTLETHCRCH